jgi:excisionase family DNA binding protein
MDTLPLQPLLTFKQAAALLGLPENSLRRYIRERKIPYLRIGKLIRFDPVELQAWLDSRRVRAAREESLERQERRDFKGLEDESEDE